MWTVAVVLDVGDPEHQLVVHRDRALELGHLAAEVPDVRPHGRGVLEVVLWSMGGGHARARGFG